MINSGTWETGKEIRVTYPKEQRQLYKDKNDCCIYGQFERQVGINKGNFVEMVVKKNFEDQGYNVASYYYLVRNRKKREGMPGFKKICQIFGETQVRTLIAESDRAFRSKGKNISSGDPYLFVYNEKIRKYFFIEAKENDQIILNQKVLFPLIQKYLCPLYVARVSEQ